MNRKLVSHYVVAVLLTSTLILSLKVPTAKASGTIYIKADGSIQGTTYIQTTDRINYIFTANINDSIFVERSNIVIDGNGYAVQGTQAIGSIGILLYKTINVTIQNTQVKAFWLGVVFDSSSSSKLKSNTMVNNTQGFYVYGSDLSDFMNDVDPSNTVNGKPIYYWLNRQDMTVPLDAGFVALVNCTRITVQNQNMEGILLAYTTNSTITKNSATNNMIGVQLHSSSNNIISENNIASTLYGIDLDSSSGNILSSNTMVDNGYAFGVDGLSLSDFMNYVDTSNTVNGKPIYYWLNRQVMSVPLDAGFVALINCTRINAQNLNLTRNMEGILLAYTTNSTITQNNVTNNAYGIRLYSSSNNTISRNDVASNSQGIEFYYYSSSNVIIENNITNNGAGMFFSSSGHNTIYHNNFENNFYHASIYPISTNVWDDGYPSGGNYWGGCYYYGNYSGADANGDGIGDKEYEIGENNIDHYPLMGTFSDFNVTSEYSVQTVCNSSISRFQFNGTAITFDVTGENGTAGFCRICIPKTLMNDTFRVFVNGTEILPPPEPLPCSNSTHNYLYFNYTHSTQEVIIIPEFPSFLIPLIFMLTTLLAVVAYRRKRIASGRG
jgi:parallel beta-helix repeat protein